MQTFRKNERLCKRTLINELFNSGNSFRINPFLVYWQTVQEKAPSPVQVMFAIGSRNIKSAVKRNYIRRLIREAYRLHKKILYDFCALKQWNCAVAIVYTGSEKLTLKEATNKIILILRRLQTEYEKASG